MAKTSSRVYTANGTKNAKAGDTSSSNGSPPNASANIALKLRILQNAVYEYQKAGGKVQIIDFKAAPAFTAISLDDVGLVGNDLVLLAEELPTTESEKRKDG